MTSDKKKEYQVLIKDPVKSDLKVMQNQINSIQNRMQLMINSYLVGVGHDSGSVIISQDFNFVTITKKEEVKDDKKGNG